MWTATSVGGKPGYVSLRHLLAVRFLSGIYADVNPRAD